MPTPVATLFRPTDLHRLRAARPDLRIIDVRTPAEFAARHIPGSYNVPLPELAEHRAELLATGAGPVVLVCESGRRAGLAERRLIDVGLSSLHVLDGGVVAWEAEANPLTRLQTSDQPWVLERQVRLVAGGIVATAVAASTVWPPARFVAGAVGAGLVMAAVTNSCVMGTVLSKLPYNRRRPGTCDMPTVIAQITGPDVADNPSAPPIAAHQEARS